MTMKRAMQITLVGKIVEGTELAIKVLDNIGPNELLERIEKLDKELKEQGRTRDRQSLAACQTIAAAVMSAYRDPAETQEGFEKEEENGKDFD